MGSPEERRGTCYIGEAMSTAPAIEPPLRRDEGGTLRIGSTRVPLDTVAAAFRAGATPEQIVNHFPALDLVDVYTVVTWMLRNPSKVDEYLAARRAQADLFREEIESDPQHQALRARLLARRVTVREKRLLDARLREHANATDAGRTWDEVRNEIWPDL